MWQFRVSFYDPEVLLLRTWIGDIAFSDFMTTYLAAHLAVEHYEIALPGVTKDMIVQDIDIFEEVLYRGEETTSDDQIR